MKEEEFLTVKEVAAFIKVAPITIYRYTRQGEMPHIKIKRKLLFKKSDIVNWVEQQSTNKNRF